MVALPLRELIENKLDELTEDQLRALLHYIEVIEQPGDEQESNPLEGFFLC